MAQLPDLVAVRRRGGQGLSNPGQELNLLQPLRAGIFRLALAAHECTVSPVKLNLVREQLARSQFELTLTAPRPEKKGNQE